LSRTTACATDLAVFADILIHSVSADGPEPKFKEDMNSLLGEGPVKEVFAGGRGQNLDPPPRSWPDTRRFAK